MTAASRTGQHFLFRVDGGPGAPARARRLVAAGVSAVDLKPDLVDDLLLAVSEVVTNSVKYGSGGEDDVIELMLALDSECVRIDVCDNGTGFTPDLAAPRRGRAGGLGLQLVEALSDRWGVDGSEPTRVWFELRPASARASY